MGCFIQIGFWKKDMDYRQDVMLGAFVPALGGYSYNL